MLEFILVNLCVCIALAEIHLTFYFQKWVVCHFDPNFGSPFKFSVPKRKRKRKRNSLSRVPKKERCLFIGFQANAQMSVRIQFISTIPLRFTSISNLPSSPFSTSRLLFDSTFFFSPLFLLQIHTPISRIRFVCTIMHHSHFNNRLSRS